MKGIGLVMMALLAGAAAAEPPTENIVWQLGGAADLVARAKSAPVAELDADVYDLLARVEVEIGASRITERIHRITRYRTSEGIQTDGSIRVPFDAASERVVFHEVSIVSPDGSERRFDPASSRVVDANTFDVFTDLRYVVLTLPGLTEGAILVLDFSRVSERRRLKMPWLGIYHPQIARPRERVEIRIAWDQSEPAWHNDYEPMHCERSDRALLCVAEDVPPRPFDPDVTYLDVMGQFTVGEGLTWDDLIASTLEKIDTALASRDGLQSLLDEFGSNADSSEDLQRRIHHFAARDVQYVSLSEGDHRITPHAVSQTIANRYGDCKDKSALLLALLRAAGSDAYPVLVATDRSDPSKLSVPGLGYFDHMVVCLELANGETCMDATDAYTDAETTPSWIQGRVALRLVPGATPRTVPRDEVRWRVRVRSDLNFDGGGVQHETQVREHIGAYAGNLRRQLLGLDAAGRQRWALEDYQATVSNLAEPIFEFEGVDDLASKLVIRSRASYENIVDPATDFDHVESSAWLEKLVGEFSSGNQHYPFEFPGVLVTSTYSFDVDERWRIGYTGGEVNLASPFGTLVRSRRPDGDHGVVFETRLHMPARRIEVSELPDFNRFLEVLGRESRMRIVAKLR